MPGPVITPPDTLGAPKARALIHVRDELKNHRQRAEAFRYEARIEEGEGRKENARDFTDQADFSAEVARILEVGLAACAPKPVTATPPVARQPQPPTR